MEIPKNLPTGSVIYLQNVLTDLLLGLPNGQQTLINYIQIIQKLGYKPGFITLNPKSFFDVLGKSYGGIELYLCYNLNNDGFNLFPNKLAVERITDEIKNTTQWKVIAMSIFSSGGSKDIIKSIKYIKSKNLDYVVFGSSKIKNIQSNYELFTT